MKRFIAAAALASSFALPAFAQPAEIVCDDFLGMDNAQQMATIAELEGQLSEMALTEPGGGAWTAEQVHERLTADCVSQPDVLIVDVLKTAK
jgi:hypothetical protein